MWMLVKLLAAVAVYGAAIEPRFVDRVDHHAAVPHLPAAWEGRQVAVFADLQIGMWWSNRDAVRKVVRQVVELRPAFVLIAGDFVYDADDSVEGQMIENVALLRPLLDAGIPVYAVLGNHDYSLMNEGSKKESYVAAHVRRALDSAGVHMMDNKVLALYAPGTDSTASTPLYLAGLGDRWAKNDSASTVERVPSGAPRIVFMHDPDSFAAIPAGEAPFAVAAHTHGMQVGIPWLSDWLWRHEFSANGSGVAGWIADYGQAGNRLYVNRGIGFSIVPMRVHAMPELTVFTLVAGDAASAPARQAP